ncbi:MAG: efflux RND transporter periplasmic adaptor subunit [Tepidisphaeraceae bacterium]
MQPSNPNSDNPVHSGHDGNSAAILAPVPSAQSRVATDVPPRTGLKLTGLAIILAIALIAGFAVVSHRAAVREEAMAEQTTVTANEPPAVDVVSVQNAPATQSLVLPGETRAWYETTIYARVNGYVGNWSSDIGDAVKKGQVMATIETPELDDQLAAAKAKWKASQAEVTVQQANTAFAKTTYDRWWNSPKGVVSDQEREAKKAEYDSDVAREAAAESQVNLAQADIDSLAALTQFKQVTAPFDGIVTSRRIDIGGLVTAGSTSGTTSLYTVAQFDKIRVFADVPESASVQMIEGTPAQITAEELPGRVFQGTVSRSSRAIDSNTKTMKVELDIPNSDLVLLPGMYVHVNFQLKQSGLLQIPASALVFRSAGPQVATVDEQGKVTFHNVTIASDQGDVVEIGAGISAGQEVALNIGDQIADGDRVAATRDQAPSVASSISSHPPGTLIANVSSDPPGRQ